MRKYVLAALAVAMLSLLALGAAAEDVDAEGADGVFEFTVKDGKATIDGFAGEYAGALVIPATVSDGTTDYPVVAIEKQAFMDCTGIIALTLPGSVLSIGDKAFKGCTSLTSVAFAAEPESMEICDYAFSGCTSLVDFQFPEYLSGILRGAFEGCTSLESADLYETWITVIEGNVFKGCTSLATVSIPSSIVKMGGAVFSGCTALTTAQISWDLTEVPAMTFYGCESLTEFQIPASVKKIGFGAFDGCASIDGLVIPEGVTEILNNAFRGCTSLNIPGLTPNLEEIGSYAFSGTALASANIPATVYEIGAGAFESTDVESFNVSEGCIKYVSVDGLLYIADMKTLVACPSLVSGAVTVPDTVDEIMESAFSGCTGLQSVYLSGYLGSIGESAFAGCTGLTEVEIPENITKIQDRTFYGCSSLETVDVSYRVASIGEYAFAGCDSLKMIEFSSALNSLKSNSFEGQTFTDFDGTVLTYKDPRSFAGYVFKEDANGDLNKYDYSLYYREAEDGTYVLTGFTAKPFGVLDLSSMVNPGNVLGAINDGVFEDCTDITEVILPATLKDIGERAFAGCTGIQKVTFAGSVDTLPQLTIWDEAFMGCTELADFQFPESLVCMKRAAFQDCSSLTSADLSGTTLFDDIDAKGHVVTKGLEGLVFSGCTSLTSAVLPDTLFYTGGDLFKGCTSLASAVLPAELRKIEAGMFNGCSALESVAVPETILSVGYSAFTGCSSLAGISLPDSVKALGNNVFEGCSSLTSFTIGPAVTYIGDKAFFGTGLVEVTVPASVKKIGPGAFAAPNLKAINVEEGNTNYYSQGGALGTGDEVVVAWPAAYFDEPGVFILSGAKEICDYAFYGCNFIIGMKLPDTLVNQAIGEYAFAECKSLKSVTLPEQISKLKTGTFSGCTSLTTVKMNDLLSAVDEKAFAGCTSLKHIYFSNALNSVKADSFEGLTFVDAVGEEIDIANQVDMLRGFYFKSVEPGVLKLAGSKILYELSDQGIVITGVTGDPMATFVIPASHKIDGKVYDVVGIDAGVFRNCDRLVSVVLPATLKSIGEGAFYGCDSLVNVSFEGEAGSELTIGDEAFKDCISLKSFQFPAGLTNLLRGAFEGCTSLEEADLSATSLVEIQGNVFKDCQSLTSVSMPDTVVKMGGAVFSGCIYLKEVTIPDQIKVLGGSMFKDCILLEKVVLPQGLESIGYEAFRMCPNLATVEHGELTYIGNKAFYGCGSLEEFDLGSKLTYIGNYAFCGTGINELDIPATVTKIGAGAFSMMDTLFFINVAEGSSYKVVDNLLYTADGKTLVACPGALAQPVTVPEGVTKIMDSAFMGSDITDLTLPGTLDKQGIGRAAFALCYSLEFVAIPDNITKIKEDTFYGCISLKFLDLGSRLSAIDSRAFYQCFSLDTIYFSENISSIKSDSFEGVIFNDENGNMLDVTDESNVRDYTFIGKGDGTVMRYVFTITFDTDGGSDVDPIVQSPGTKVKTPGEPYRHGYDFRGWEPAVPETMPMEDMTIKAVWTETEYTVTFDTNGGSPVAPVYGLAGSVVPTPADPVKEGFTFVGWEPAVPAYMPGHNVVCWAQWEPVDVPVEKFDLVFDTDGGSSIPTVQYAAGESVVVPADPVKEGFTFVGWEPAIPATMPANDLTVKAVWKAAEVPTYTITFNTDGGSAVDPIVLEEGAKVVPPKAPVKDGFEFVGWEPALPETMPANDLTVKAVWKELPAPVVKYTVTFDSNGGSAVASAEYAEGEKIVLPEDPVREGYEFKGWEPAVPETMPANDLAFKAVWEAVPEPEDEGSNTMLYVGIAVVLIVIIGAVAYFVSKRR